MAAAARITIRGLLSGLLPVGTNIRAGLGKAIAATAPLPKACAELSRGSGSSAKGLGAIPADVSLGIGAPADAEGTKLDEAMGVVIDTPAEVVGVWPLV